MVTLVTATGKTIECIRVARGVGNDLLIYTDKLSFSQASDLFIDSNETSKLTVASDEEDIIYEGYTTLRLIQSEPNIGESAILIVMSR